MAAAAVRWPSVCMEGAQFTAGSKWIFKKKQTMESTISPVEAEYIKNLQLQIYFLELEASFLREQTKKATNLQPRLSEEADHILHKLQDLHSQCNGLKLEVKRRDASLLILRRDQDNLRGQVQSAEVTHSKDKQQMVEDVVRLKKLKELTDLQTSQREMEILKIKQELDRELTNLASNEQRVRSIQSQIKQRSEQKQTVENQLSEKRVDLLKVNSAKREMDEKLLKRTAITQNQITVDLRNELSFLHQQIRDRDMQSEQDRVLRSKMMADCELLANEKNTLSNQLMELNKQLEMQRGLKEENYSYDSSSIAQLLSVKDREEQLSSEITRHKELLHLENIHFKDMTEQVNLFQNGKKLQDLHMATSSSRITELQAVLAKENQINSELRRDKSLLVDHVTNLQAQIINKDAELGHILSRIEALETRMSTVRTDHELQKTLQAGRWQEISDMADSMKKLTRPLDSSLASFERL